jgi:pyruvate dehydrogenase E2 component (dihydrolipoamide acetyltransferase)
MRRDGSGMNHLVRAADLSEPPLKLKGIRQTIAKRMRESLATTAQYTMHASADATVLLALRKKLKAMGGDEAAVNINDLVMYVTVRTLLEIPALNSELIDGEIFEHKQVDLAFACDTPRGLVVPVVRDSQDMALTALATRIHTLAEQAANGTLSPDDMTGGSFTVSNLGSLGVEAFTPIVNPPQVAILGVNAIQLKPVRRNGEVEFVDRIGFSLTCDHQVVDGAPGARFLQQLTKNVEDVAAITGIADREN